MKIKECKNYFDCTCIELSKVDKKIKFKALGFIILIAILCLIPFVCLYINLFMQYLGIKIAIYGLIISCGVMMYILVNTLNVLYYVSLSELCDKEKVSFKKLYLASLTDLFVIISILIFVILLIVFVSFMLY